MTRVNVYSAMHKAQRKRMFDLASDMGRADFEDTATVNRLRADLERIIANLREHAQYEEKFVHPLFAEVGAVGQEPLQSLHDEHNALEILLEAIEARVKDNFDAKLYADINRLIATYLIHIDKEETAQESLLWPNFDNARMAGVMETARLNTSPPQAMENLRFMLPCLSVAEATGFLLAAKATAPAPAFQAVCEVAKQVMPADEWAIISAKL